MRPADLQPAQFAGYPPQSRQLAIEHLDLLRRLPLTFVPLLLREVIGYDWKFPVERRELDNQFLYLAELDTGQLQQVLQPFAKLQLSSELEHANWVNDPTQFSEQLTAHLWATHQIDQFRAGAVDYVRKLNIAKLQPQLPAPRLGIVLIGQGVSENRYRLFRKLRPHGVYFGKVNPRDGRKVLMDALAARATAHPIPFAHWYVDGGESIGCEGVSCISYRALDSLRAQIVTNMTKVMESGIGPEALRTKLARMTPDDFGMKSVGVDAVLNRFQLSVLTEGSGTQIYSTTFVQWAARELLRRAQPLTLLARFAPRLREQSIKDLLAEERQRPLLDPEGSLRDADMGAYYTWLNQQRLPGADQSRFLVWFEDHSEAVAIAPSMKAGSEASEAIDLKELVGRIA
jgi:hypothetical protein